MSSHMRARHIVLTVDHGDHAVLSLLAGRLVGDHLNGDGVAFVGLQLGDEVGGGVSAGASGVDQHLGVLVETLDGVGVVVSLRGPPGAGDGGGALRTTVEAVDSLRLYSKRHKYKYSQCSINTPKLCELYGKSIHLSELRNN